VLLAVTVFAIVLAAINTVFYSALRLRARTSAALDESAPVEQTLNVMRRDLQAAVGPGGVLAGDFKSGSVSSGLGIGQASAIEFYTASGVIRDDPAWGDIRKVNYQLRDPMNRTTPRGKDLFRLILRNPLATTAEEDEQFLMGDVESLDFVCYDGTTWRDSWDTSQSDTTLPSAIKVRLRLAAANGTDKREPIEMVVPIFSQTNTNQTQTVEGLQ